VENDVSFAVAMAHQSGAHGKPREDLLYHDLVSLIARGRVQALVRDLVQPLDLFIFLIPLLTYKAANRHTL